MSYVYVKQLISQFRFHGLTNDLPNISISFHFVSFVQAMVPSSLKVNISSTERGDCFEVETLMSSSRIQVITKNPPYFPLLGSQGQWP